jgi:hypothetical protein
LKEAEPMTLRNTPFALHPLSPAIGGRVDGLDLADPISDETVAALKDGARTRYEP